MSTRSADERYPVNGPGPLMLAACAPGPMWPGDVISIETFPQAPCVLVGVDVPAGATLREVVVGNEIWFGDPAEPRWLKLGAVLPGMRVYARAHVDEINAGTADPRPLRIVFGRLP